MRPLTFLSTFTGIGGMDLGLERAGMQCLGMCEIDDKARSVLDSHWKDIPKHDDITTAISSGWADQFVGRVDILVGGAPCQDLSIAGKRAGFEGERSVLYFDMVALAAFVGAKYVVYENVSGLLTSNEGRDFGAAVVALAEAGFPHVEWRMLDSQHFGVPQRRNRVFTIGCAGEDGGHQILVEPESGVGDLTSINTQRENAATRTSYGIGMGGEALDQPWMVGPVTGTLNAGGHPGSYNGQDAHTNLFLIEGPRPEGIDVYPSPSRKSRRAQTDTDYEDATDLVATFSKKHRASSTTDYESWAQDNVHPTLNVFDVGDTRATALIVDPAVAQNYTVRRLTPTECERLQGLPDGWTAFNANGKPQSDSARYRQLGNAVTANVAEYVGRLINLHAHAVGHA